jgi:hypothetical protein
MIVNFFIWYPLMLGSGLKVDVVIVFTVLFQLEKEFRPESIEPFLPRRSDTQRGLVVSKSGLIESKDFCGS